MKVKMNAVGILFILLTLLSGAARAETIIMKCENFVYRWTDRSLGAKEHQIEIREDGRWKQLCFPGAQNVNGVKVAKTCEVGDKYLFEKLGDVTVNSKIYRSWTLLDFKVLKKKEHWREYLGAGAIHCSRLGVRLS